jgi:hypothetical protein
VDDCFARTAGNLSADWSKGLTSDVVGTLVQALVLQYGYLVGWQIENDLSALGFEDAAVAVRAGARSVTFAEGVSAEILELTDHFKTTNGSRCQLTEAHSFVFDRRTGHAHNAGTDIFQLAHSHALPSRLYNHAASMLLFVYLACIH